PLRLEALWVYQSLDVVEPRLLGGLLTATDHRVRAAATRVAGAWADRLAHPLEAIAPRIADEHPQVRLEAVRALARVPSPSAAETALIVLDRSIDKPLDYALWLTLRELEPQWMPAFQAGRFNYGGKTNRLLFALQAVGTKNVLPTLVDLV